MTEKELRKLTRYQLLELLILQTERADKLQQELEALRKKQEEQDIRSTVVGSIAEEAMQLSGIFEAAQKAADQYVEAVKQKADALLAQIREQAAEAEKPQPEPEQRPDPQPEPEQPAADRTEKLWNMLEAL